MVTIGTDQIKRRGFYGDRGLDITIKSSGPIGKIFAPTWGMVMGFKEGRITWEEYVEQYKAHMRVSFRKHRDIWDNILMRDQVVLLCYCRDEQHCHRSLLRDMFLRLGAHPM